MDAREAAAPKPVSRARPPGPAGLPFLGQSLKFAKDPLGFLCGIAREYGDIAYFPLGGNPVFLISHPEYVREVLITQRAKFEVSALRQRLELVLGTGLLTSRGELHARQRRLMQPVFRKSRIDAYAVCMAGYARRTRDRWRPGGEIDLCGEMMQLTMAVVAKTLFDHDVEGEADRVSRNLTLLMSYFTRLMSPFLRYGFKLPLPATLKFRRALRELDAVIYGMIAQRRRHPRDGEDLLSLLMRAEDDEINAVMTEKQLRDELLTLFLAGHETTANALTWTIWLLAQHPDADARVHAEAASVLADRDRFDAGDADRLSYARKVIMEGLRLYPPAWFVGRTPLEDVRLGGYTIPQGATVLLSQYVSHRDGRFFDDPERFRPERWTEEFQQRLPRGAYFPFSAGDRHCIGEGFAWLEALLILATLLERWKFELAPGQDIAPRPAVTLRPGSEVRVVVRLRDSGNLRERPEGARPAIG